ncbi:hypothetical protein [Methylocucumis oryzae]|uniref:Lipoprotein n=1 Tax=Methylocucumis oryzae TaxID=1632867 RepID=A0A0F3ILG1_9GAMM|nr:hypothetical protein [Methylocucumis oryzae]KJV06424.1 hypothetical protein VZ94_11450 [Methylocucumis oryzae]
MMKKTLCYAAAIAAILSLTLSGCSDEKEKTNTTPTVSAPKPNNPFDHSKEPKVTESEKQTFEQQFADQCVARELKNSTNPDNDKPRLTKSCTCIAMFMMKDLTPQEAEKFLVEHENPQSLRIKYENAAYHCLQEKVPPHEPDFSRPSH